MINFRDAGDLVLGYCHRKFRAQLKSISFIVCYLFVFQVLVLGMPIRAFGEVAFGLLLVVFGLMFFMEGLVLGVMPIGEGLGLKLPSKAPIALTMLFALILGAGATFAEPAISTLQALGSNVDATKTPLLAFILIARSFELVLAVALGVGLAVALGILRFLYNFSLKVLLYPIVLLAVALSSLSLYHSGLSEILGLAWDCGAVTTGPVTVPLVIALGLGISRVVSGNAQERSSSGLGIVTLASLLPVIAVLLLGIFYHSKFGEDELRQMISLGQVSTQQGVTDWRLDLTRIFLMASKAILPLCFFIMLIFRGYLRERFAQKDEIFLGIVFSLIGMTLFSFGIERGLGRLGQQVGELLPSAYTSIQLKTEAIDLQDFDLDQLHQRFDARGGAELFFYLKRETKTLAIKFDPQHYDASTRTYRFVPEHGPLMGTFQLGALGLSVVLLFAFFMGYGATLAEPALNTLGATVENISVGTFRKTSLVHTVATGVGLGIAVGVTKIIWHVPLIWLIVPSYLLLLFLTFFSNEDYANIAWDSAGVTTGPVTVPLVIAMGMGIGQQTGAVEGFGILSMASICPIMTVLIGGILVNRKRKRQLADEKADEMEVSYV